MFKCRMQGDDDDADFAFPRQPLDRTNLPEHLELQIKNKLINPTINKGPLESMWIMMRF